MSTKIHPDIHASIDHRTSGDFVSIEGERYYAINNVDQMAPFFISLVSSGDHWLFISSTGGLTAGRVSPETMLFPYITVDKIHESIEHTGSKSIFRVNHGGQQQLWEPFARVKSPLFNCSRNIYKNLLGNKIFLEEINHDLQLLFRYSWSTSNSHGFIRQCSIENVSSNKIQLEILDGLQNILPAGTPAFAQTNSSNLVDAYKWSEIDEQTGLGLFTLYSGISDKAEPSESLKANTVYSLGLNNPRVLVSSTQLENFRSGITLESEAYRRGIRGAYFVSTTLKVDSNDTHSWTIVADIEKSQREVVRLQTELLNNNITINNIQNSIDSGSDKLARIIAAADGYQTTNEENVSAHHYANVLFNVLRGGIFDDQYSIDTKDFISTVEHFNSPIASSNTEFLSQLPERINLLQLRSSIEENGDSQLERLYYDYLPITFGRRHGDPSRPWNKFSIKLKDEDGNRLISYEGNWRDIFQNWEALALSYPEFIENIIAKFVNASTIDGYNPYRITKDGIDWEVEDPEDPWSYIGYWGDHQIIYLQKLLEASKNAHPNRLNELLYKQIYCYANVPYRIKSFEKITDDPKNTVVFDDAAADLIEDRIKRIGADGKLLIDKNNQVYQVSLIEKLLVTLLSKLGNLVIDGGIWLNTQRPEWNDANNALVGHGLSMVTLYYLRRYLDFLQNLLEGQQNEPVLLSTEVTKWLNSTATALARIKPQLGGNAIDPASRYAVLEELGQAASEYREQVYSLQGYSGKESLQIAAINQLVDDALVAVDHSISTNKSNDGLYHAYNLINLKDNCIEIDNLYPMLEGQVAILSATAIDADAAADVIDALFSSDVYRPDQKSFMLYPDREATRFLDKNRVPVDQVIQSQLLSTMLKENDESIILQDESGEYRFNSDFTNAGDLLEALQRVDSKYLQTVETEQTEILDLYETVFNQKAFTGRSGGMFGFEGLGCIYWHMVSKLLLALQENYFAAIDMQDASEDTQHRLGALYYKVREGLGFNKTPLEFGAFPMDPYSHTPKHAGARQPGMTGQVKEEIITRFGELGACIKDGEIHFKPYLLRRQEFSTTPHNLKYLDVDSSWQTIEVPKNSLAYTWCQVPIVYQLSASNDAVPSVTLLKSDGTSDTLQTSHISDEESSKLFSRNGAIRQIQVTINESMLFNE